MPRVSSPVFVGRASELDRLCRAFEEAGEGRPATRLIVGEAGIGKTRLVAEFMSRARDEGAHVLVGDCLQLGDTGLPYAPFVGALRHVLRGRSADDLDRLVGPGRAELAHLLPDLGPPAPRPPNRPDASVSAVAAQARMFEIVFGMLRRLADERTLVLVLEDLHWADASTRDLLRFLVRNARDARFLFVVTYRSDEMHRRHPLLPLVAELSRLPNVDDIELPAFGEAEVTEQLAGILGEAPRAGLVTEVLERSGGNPFFAEELVAAGESGLVLPRTLRDMLVDRIRPLDDAAQAVLRVAAVAGGRLDHRLLQDVVSLGADELAAGLREAIEHHLLLPTSPELAPAYAFRHALLQEAVYEELLPGERTQLHAALARAIEGRPELGALDPSGAAAQLAHHWFLAHELDRALSAAIEAGRAAAAGYAFTEAETLLRRALELWPKVAPDALPADITRTDILVEAAEASAQAGEPRHSIELVRSALAEIDAISDPMMAGVLHHRLAWYLNEAGDWKSGARAMERAVELIPIDPPTRERARVLADLALSLMVRGRYSDSLAVAEAALAISRAVGARGAEARALDALGLDIAGRSDFERSLPILREGYARASELDDPQAVFLTAVGLGWALDETGRHRESLALARDALARLRDLGAATRYGGQMASKEARALFELGRWDEADAVMEETLATGPTRYAVRWLLSNRVRLHVFRGRLDAARLDLMTYESLGERVVGPDPDLMNSRRAELAIEAGEPVTARELVQATLEQTIEPDVDADARALYLIGLWAELDEHDAARTAGDAGRIAAARERAAELVDRVRRHVARVGETVAPIATVVEADSALAEAIAAQIGGELDPERWERAVDTRRAIGRPFEIARVLARAAETFLAARRRDDATAALVEAHAIATRLGATTLRTRVEALARRGRIGLDGVETADQAAERMGLTPREREVLALLAEGRSNRQIGEHLYMAESTAGVHVSNILTKLGVTRRSEAAVIAHRIGLAGSV
ncbi:MAG TPA: AAA family ATPase [Candidatus Angelobacter sp.]|nr:AAA family ATPase [Candidatus Angelobacter sp.]